VTSTARPGAHNFRVNDIPDKCRSPKLIFQGGLLRLRRIARAARGHAPDLRPGEKRRIISAQSAGSAADIIDGKQE
jgi:hypothetical protein